MNTAEQQEVDEATAKMPALTTTEAEVLAAISNAHDNGYLFTLFTDEALADDLMTYCSNLEDSDEAEVLAAVRAWRTTQ